MNLLKTISIGLLAAALPGVASASTTPTILRIAGSTAFRASVDCAIVNYLGGASCKVGYVGLSSAGTVVKNNLGIYANGTVSMVGTTNNGTATVIILTNWTGSLAGVVDLAVQNTSLPFLDPTKTSVTGPLTGAGAGTLNGSVISVDGTNGITDSSAKVAGDVSGLISQGNPAAFASTGVAPDVAMTDAFSSSCASAVGGANLTGQPGSITVSPLSGAGLATLIKTAPLAEAGGVTTTAVVSAGSANGYLGIVPFEWVLGNDTGTGAETVTPFTNITSRIANFLIVKGYAPFTMFSATNFNGGANDPHKFVYLIGRNEDSGTRIDAFAEPYLGFVQNPVQSRITFTGGATTSSYPTPTDYSNIGGAAGLVESIDPWPANATLNTEPTINWSSAGGGHGGYAGGGDVSSVLSTPVDQANVSGTTITSQNVDDSAFAGGFAPSYLISYLGIADAGNFTAPTSVAGASAPSGVTKGTSLTFNGVPFSPANVQSGAYSFWCYEHMYYLTGGTGAITSSAKTVADTIADNISTTYANYNSSGLQTSVNPAGVLLPTNATAPGFVTRSVEGGSYTLSTY